MTARPIQLHDALAAIDAMWSPRTVARVNDYDVRVVKVAGDFVWHVHDDTDELFLVLDGDLVIALRDAEGEHAVALATGALYVVPKGIEHRPSSPAGASVLLLEPTGTVNVGDRHDDLPGHIRPSRAELLG